MTRFPPLAVALGALTMGGTLGCGRAADPEPATTGTDSVPAFVMAPIPDGALGASIRRGQAIFTATADSLPDHVGNDLSCSSCHLDGGTRPGALPLQGIYAQFPQYRPREDRVFSIEDRINGCMLRSMNGTTVPLDDPRLRDMVAFLSHLGRGIPAGETVAGQGLVKPEALAGDTVAGAAIWIRECARCHGVDGAGTPLAPPTWGDRSFNVGAGMARLRTAAGFILPNMPFDRPGTLSPEEAIDVAAYLVSRPRPDFAGKEHDWPLGNAPPDAAYPTLGAAADPR